MTTRNTNGNSPSDMALLRNRVRASVGINEQQAVIGDGNGTVRIDAEPGHVWVRLQQGNGLSTPIKALANAVMSYYEGADCYVANIGVNLAVVRPRLTNEQTPLVWNYIDSDLNIASATSSFDIQNITQNYNEWRLTMFLRSDRASNAFDWLNLRLNADTTTSNYVTQTNYSIGATNTAAQHTATAGFRLFVAATLAQANHFSSIEMIIRNPIDTGKLTSAEFRWDAINNAGLTGFYTVRGHALYNSVSAINRIQLIPELGTNWIAGSGWLLEGKVY